MPEVKILQFPNNEQGQQKKVQALQEYLAAGWTIISETVTQGHFRGSKACCLFLVCEPLALTAGYTEGIITVTLQRDEEELIGKLAKIREEIADAEESQNWERMKDLCHRFLSIRPNDETIEKKMELARLNIQAAPFCQKAKEAYDAGNWRAMEQHLAQYLELIPQDKKTQESRELALKEIEQLKAEIKTKLMSFLVQARPDEAISSAEHIPSWLQQEKEISEILQAAPFCQKAKEAYDAGNWRAMERYLAQYLELIPQDKKTQESRERALMEIERLKAETKTHLMSFLAQAQPDEAISSAEHIPYWLQQEKEVAEILQAALCCQKAKEAYDAGNWRAMEQYLALYLELIPQDKKTQESRDWAIMEIERLKAETKTNLMSFLAQVRPDKAISSAEHIPYWLQQEKEISEILKMSNDLIEANDDLMRGKWASAIEKMKQWKGLTGCAWIDEWFTYSINNLNGVRYAFKRFLMLVGGTIAIIGLGMLCIAQLILLNPFLFLIGAIMLAGGIILFLLRWLLALLIRGSLKGRIFKGFLPVTPDSGKL